MENPSMIPFDPNAPAPKDAGIFGLPYDEKNAHIYIIPATWDVTTSYRPGTHKGPDAIRQASAQVDLMDLQFGAIWQKGIYMAKSHKKWIETNKKLRKKAERILDYLTQGGSIDQVPAEIKKLYQDVNEGCASFHLWLKQQAENQLNKGKFVVVLGGDHSTPMGLVQALADRHPQFGFLQIDAHADLRNAYEGFTFSHASITRNISQLPQVQKIVQVGLRDVCDEEWQFMEQQRGRIVWFHEFEIQHLQNQGKSWKHICDEIISSLPEKVYVSWDIDGLDPSLCPHTGTPVPGGLSWAQAYTLIATLQASGKEIIGMDLNEVSPGKDEWDANVGARLLYKMLALAP